MKRFMEVNISVLGGGVLVLILLNLLNIEEGLFRDTTVLIYAGIMVGIKGQIQHSENKEA